jgi:hypothetical protein
MKPKTVKISSLVFDPNLLSIRQVNDQVVARYKQSYLAGAAFPPVVAEVGTNRITSGNHRVRAMLAAFGPDHESEAIFKKFKNEGEFLLEAARENSTHGNPLSGIERKLLATALREQGITDFEIAQAMFVSASKLVWMLDNTVPVITIGENKEQVVKAMPHKRFLPIDKPISTEQYKIHMDLDLGLPVEQLAAQVTRRLKWNMVDRSESTMAVMSELRDALNAFFGIYVTNVQDRPVADWSSERLSQAQEANQNIQASQE